jgi:predicted acyl esterase
MRPHREQPSDAEADESRDMADTVDWLLKNVPGNNGKVGIWGISYPGFYTSASIIDSHPAIKAASPEAPVTNMFEGDDAYHNGAFMLAAQFQLYSKLLQAPPRRTGVPGNEPRPVRLRDKRRLFLLSTTRAGSEEHCCSHS